MFSTTSQVAGDVQQTGEQCGVLEAEKMHQECQFSSVARDPRMVVKNTFIDLHDDKHNIVQRRWRYRSSPDVENSAEQKDTAAVSDGNSKRTPPEIKDILEDEAAAVTAVFENMDESEREAAMPTGKHLPKWNVHLDGCEVVVKNTFIDIDSAAEEDHSYSRRAYQTCPDSIQEYLAEANDFETMPVIAEEQSSHSAYDTTRIDPKGIDSCACMSATQSCTVEAVHVESIGSCDASLEHPVLLGKANLLEALQGGRKLRIKNTFLDIQGESTPTPVNRRAFRTCPDMESEEVIQQSDDERDEYNQQGATQRSPSLESAPEGAPRYVDYCRQAQEPPQTRAARNAMYNTEDLRESLGQEPLQTRSTRNTMYNTEDLRESLYASNGGTPCCKRILSALAEVAQGSSGAARIENDHMPCHAQPRRFPADGKAATQQANKGVLTSKQVPVSLHANIHTVSNQPANGTQKHAAAIPAQGFAPNPPFQIFSMNPYYPMNQMHLHFAQTSTSAMQHPPVIWNASLPPVHTPPTMAATEGGAAVLDYTNPVKDPLQEDLAPPPNAECTLQGELPRGRRLRLWAHIYLHMEEKGFDLVPRLIGRKGENMRKIAEETNAKVRIRGKGSGHFEVDGKLEAPTPLMVAVTTDHEQQIAFSRAIEMTLQELRKMEQRYQTWCHKKNVVPEGPYFSIGLLSEGANKVLGNLLDGVPMSGPAKSRR